MNVIESGDLVRLRRVVVAVAAALTLFGVGAVPVAAEPAPRVGSRSGLPFDLGVFAHSPDRVARFEEKVGRKVDVWQVAPQREEGAGVLLSETRRIVGEAPEGVIFDLAVPLVSRGEARELGKALAARPGSHYVRPGWEFNLSGSWAWTVDRIGVDAFKAGFVEAAAGFREGCPACRIEWNPNSGRSGGAVEGAAKAWPGDEWVDVVGVDVYDWADGDGGDAAFTGPGGLDEWAAFTRQHGKRMSLPEWGVHGVQGRGDDADWAGRVIDWVVANRDIVVMASYFDEPADYIRNSIADGQMPATGAALRDRFSKLAASPPAPSATIPSSTPTGAPSGPPSWSPTPWAPPATGVPESAAPTGPVPWPTPTYPRQEPGALWWVPGGWFIYLNGATP